MTVLPRSSASPSVIRDVLDCSIGGSERRCESRHRIDLDQNPESGFSDGGRLSLGWTAGLVGLGGLTLVHAGNVRALRNAKASVQIRSARRRGRGGRPNGMGWSLYAGSYLLPLIRPISVYMAHEQLVELEERCTPFPI